MGGDGPVFGRADIVWSRAGCHAAATRVRERGATRRCLQAVGHGRHWCGMWCGRRGYPRALGVAPTAVLPARPRCAKDSRARKSDSPTMAARPDGNGLRHKPRGLLGAAAVVLHFISARPHLSCVDAVSWQVRHSRGHHCGRRARVQCLFACGSCLTAGRKQF